MKKNYFLNDRICLNVLAGSKENAAEIVDAAKGYVVVGVLSSAYSTVDEAALDMMDYNKFTNDRLSVGLGNGDPGQWKMVAEISAKVNPAHINQIFTAVGYTRALAGESTYINALVSPCNKPGFLKISTGILSREKDDAIVPAATAIAMVKEMGGNSLKYFPMKGLTHKDEYIALSKICAREDFDLELTGGLDLTNFEELTAIALNAGVKRIIPHVYSSIIDKSTGLTNIDDVAKLFEIMQSVSN